MDTKLKHNRFIALVGLRTITRRALVYGMSISLIAVVFFGTEFLIEKYLYDNDEVVDIVAAIVGAFAFAECRSAFETATDNIFFRGGYDYAATTQELNVIVRTTIEIKELLRMIADLIAKTIKPESVVFFLNGSNEPFTFGHPATTANAATANLRKPQENDALTIPFFSKSGEIGTMLIGEKLSGESLSPKDKQLLQVISDQAGMAIENALLYEKLREHSEDLERRVNEKTERIKEMYDAQSRFLTDIAHEFQTPISILKGNLSLLIQEPTARDINTSTTQAQSQRANTIYIMTTTLDRLSRLVTNLLDVAKFNLAKNKLPRETVDIKSLLEEAREDCLILAEDKNITISLAAEIVLILGDKDKLKEVLLNLLSNALKHTPANGAINLSAREDGENAEIVVADTGEGISPENLPKIFERFYKINAGSLAEGNGIGLHLCRQIIEAHHGTIITESVVAKGTRFIIHLPLKSRVIINKCLPPIS